MRSSQVRKLRDIIKSFGRACDAVEVCSNPDGIDARDLPDVIDMSDKVIERRADLRSFFFFFEGI